MKSNTMTLRIDDTVLYTQLVVNTAFSRTPRIYTVTIFASLKPREANQSAIIVQSARIPDDFAMSGQDRRGGAENFGLLT